MNTTQQQQASEVIQQQELSPGRTNSTAGNQVGEKMYNLGEPFKERKWFYHYASFFLDTFTYVILALACLDLQFLK